MKKKINIYSEDTEESALQQFNNCCNKEYVTAAALMPDAHTGYVAPIGAVIQTKNAIVPSWVGYDIGCGVIAVLISDNIKDQELIKNNSVQIFEGVNKTIPMGVGQYHKKPLTFNDYKGCIDITKALIVLNDYTNKELTKEITDKAFLHLGTLGSGNHFIEISTYKNETWLTIHSGSRGIGYVVAEHFMKQASGLDKGYEDTFAILDTDEDNEYMLYHRFCLAYALENRMCMAVAVENVIKRITKIEYDSYKNLWCNKNHNHCVKLENGEYLHRKGATSSNLNERGVIPANMRDGCFLVEGLGNVDFLNSSSHGAGRVMSRGFANKNVSLGSFKETMKGIIAPVNKETLDESPFAYKEISKVMELQKESVKILKHLKPIINWKGLGVKFKNKGKL